MTEAYYRILDASANRAGEGLRTLEEYARFGLDDAGLTKRLKHLRHQLATALKPLSREKMLAARDTPGDVGTAISLKTENQRGSVRDVVAAAAARTQQSMRCLEEYGKVIAPEVAAAIEQIRYQSYSIFGELELLQIVHSRREKIANAIVYVLIDAGSSDEQFASTVQTLADGGADVLQLRDRSCDDRTLYRRARIAAETVKEAETLFIVNDRPDIAAAACADGVHVGQEELPIEAARKIVGGDRLIGLSTHSIEQAREAVNEGADYIGCGPVFPGQTKSFDSYVGTAFLREIAGEIELPAFAIGGIDLSNVDEVAEAGFKRIAVTGAVRDAADPIAAIKELKKRLTH